MHLAQRLAGSLARYGLVCAWALAGLASAAEIKREGDPSGKIDRTVTRSGAKPAENDVLLLSYAQDPDTLNPITGSDNVSEAFQSRILDSLANTDFRDPDKFEPALATHWEFDPEKLEYTIHLRKGVKWHPMRLPNGTLLPETEFTARDVAFTFQVILNRHVEAAHLRSYYESTKSTDDADRYRIKVRLVDKYTITVRWTEPYFLAKEFTLAAFPIIPRHVYSVDRDGQPISYDFSSKEFAEGFNNHWANKLLCGTGPMRFKEWTRNERLAMERNPDFYGEPYFFSGVVYRCVPNPNTMRQLLLQNVLDFGSITEKDQYLQSKDNANVKAGKVRLLEFVYPSYRYIGYNLNRDLFKDKAVRMALSHAVPVQKIIDEVFKGLAVPATGPFMPGSSASDASVKAIPFDLDKARALLDGAGWKDSDGDGVRDKMIDGRKVPARFDLLIYSQAPSYQTIAEIFKEQARKIGVEVQISPAEWALMLQKVRKRDFDASMLGWALPWRQDPFQVWHSSQADVPDSSNHVAYRNPEVDKLIDQLRVTLDEKKQSELYHEIHRKIVEDQPYTFLFVDKQTGACDARLQNVNFYKVRPCYDSREWTATAPRSQGP